MDDPRCDLLHGLLNSLTIVIGECELLREDACQKANRRLNVIRQQADHMTELILQQSCPLPRRQPRREGSSGSSRASQ